MTATATPAATRGWIPPLLRQTPFRRYWTGQSVSLLGDQITELALPLFAVLVAAAGPAEMGYLTAAALVPNLLFSLLFGGWADRRAYKRQIMVAADVARAVALLAVPALYLLGTLDMTQLYLVAFTVGTFSVLFEVCRSTLFVSLVSRDDFLQANALLNGSRAFSTVAGASVGGVLVRLVGAPFALLLDALSFVFSAVMIARVEVVEPVPVPRRGLGLREGLTFIARHPIMRAAVSASTTINLFNYMYAALVILYLTTELNISAAVLGVGLGLAAVGALIGAAIARRAAERFGVGPMYVFGYLMFPAPLILIPLAGGPHWLVLAMVFTAEFLSGVGVMLLDTAAGSLQASVIPDELRARVTGAHRTINYGIRPVGALVGGALGTAIGVRETLWIATVGALAGVLWLLASPIPRMRRL
ncbi:MFS transporter [Catellatospora bangladeshensis]|uniref:MFS transporter n=1 Tax=Catellatospora bangladeshensis TaxID=310355 RepID=A0A8J3J9N9_9ACTN|nr:MFS transporter [Catellatospora bangladeshensis]GIF80196.1 MFS transporter [Catellatospora bangladeshensis]